MFVHEDRDRIRSRVLALARDVARLADMAASLGATEAGNERARRESELVWSDLVSRQQVQKLRGQVRVYTGHEERADGVRRLRELPSGDVAVIVSFGPELVITEPRAEAAVMRRSFVAGIHARLSGLRGSRPWRTSSPAREGAPRTPTAKRT